MCYNGIVRGSIKQRSLRDTHHTQLHRPPPRRASCAGACRVRHTMVKDSRAAVLFDCAGAWPTGPSGVWKSLRSSRPQNRSRYKNFLALVSKNGGGDTVGY
nr:MAG TPA: hypothetical protein [Caudoviricetes sp.]